MQPVKFLCGDAVYLRPITRQDHDVYYRALYEPTGRYFTGAQAVYSQEAVANAFERFDADDSRVDLLICSQATDEVVGDISLNSMDSNNRSGSLRLAIFEPANYSKGYGTEALILMLDYGFGIRNLHRIELHVYAYNDRAIHTYEKVGFQKEGVMRDALYYDHKWTDVFIMSMLEEEFRAKYKRATT